MDSTKYPKIQTLYNRSEENDWKVIPGSLRRPEFGLIKRWLITEKIDGRNHRIILFPDGHVEHRGRTDRAQFSKAQMEGALNIVSEDKLHKVFDANTKVILYGELYGPGVQGGGKYRKDISFRLFDVLINDEWWMEWDAVKVFADNLEILTVPVLVGGYLGLPSSLADLSKLFDGDYKQGTLTSYVAYADSGSHAPPEGIVARTEPLLFNRRGNRVVWKLKFKDFKNER